MMKSLESIIGFFMHTNHYFESMVLAASALVTMPIIYILFNIIARATSFFMR